MALLDSKQLEVLCDQSESKESPTLFSHDGYTTFTTRSKSHNQPVTSATCVGCQQDGCVNVDPTAYATVAGHNSDESSYIAISKASEPVEDESSSDEAPRLPDYKSRPTNIQSTPVAQQPAVTSSVNDKIQHVGSNVSNICDVTDISVTCLQHPQPKSAPKRMVCAKNNVIVTLALVVAIVLAVLIGESMTENGHQHHAATPTTNGTVITTTAASINYRYVGFEARKRSQVDMADEQTVIMKASYLYAGQRIVGVQVFASKPSSRTPVNFGIYRQLSPDAACLYTLIKSFPLEITAVDTVLDIMFKPSQQHTVTPDETFGIWWSTTSGGSIYFDMWLSRDYSNCAYCYGSCKSEVGASALFTSDLHIREYSIRAILA